VVHLDTGDHLTARSVIIATGVTYRMIDATGLDRFSGLGVSYSPLGVGDQIRRGDPVVIVVSEHLGRRAGFTAPAGLQPVNQGGTDQRRGRRHVPVVSPPRIRP